MINNKNRTKDLGGNLVSRINQMLFIPPKQAINKEINRQCPPPVAQSLREKLAPLTDVRHPNINNVRLDMQIWDAISR